MGVDHPSGPGKGPETIDDPSTQGSGDKPPAKNNGSSSETPRADSLRRAGWKLEGYGETRTEQHGDRDQRNDESSTTGLTGDRHGPGDPPAETNPKADKEPQAGKSGSATDDPRTKTAEAAGTDERDRPQGQPPGRETDDRPEPADRPAPAERQYRLPADNPGSPGQPSRLESLARAREAQQQRAAQNTEGTGGSGGRPGEVRDGRPAAPQEGKPSGEQAGGPVPETVRPQDREHPPLHHQDNAAAPADSGPPPGTEQNPPGADKQGTDELGSDGQDADGQAADQQGDGRLQPEPSAEAEDRTTGPAQTPPDSTHGNPEPAGRATEPARETEASPQAPDGPADSGQATPPEAPEPTNTDESDSEQPGEAAPGVSDGGTTGDAPAVPQEGEPTQPGAEPRDAPTGGTAPDGGTEDQRSTDDASPPSEETDQSAEAPEPSGEHDGDHGKKGHDDGPEQDPDETDQIKPEVPGNPIISDVHTDSRGQVHVEPRYGREHTGEPGTELARSQPETTEPAQLPDREDLDPVGAEGGEGGRGELRDPEDDPENRDYREGDADKPSRRLDLAREAFADADNIKDSIDKLTDPSQKHLERVQPTGQKCGARPNFDHIKAGDSPLQIGNAAIGIFTTGVLAVEAGRRGVRLVRNILRRNHDRN